MIFFALKIWFDLFFPLIRLTQWTLCLQFIFHRGAPSPWVYCEARVEIQTWSPFGYHQFFLVHKSNLIWYSFNSVNPMDFVFAIWIPPRGIISMSVLRSENRNSNMKSIWLSSTFPWAQIQSDSLSFLFSQPNGLCICNLYFTAGHLVYPKINEI